MVEKHVQQGNSFWNLHTQLFDEHKRSRRKLAIFLDCTDYFTHLCISCVYRSLYPITSFIIVNDHSRYWATYSQKHCEP